MNGKLKMASAHAACHLLVVVEHSSRNLHRARSAHAVHRVTFCVLLLVSQKVANGSHDAYNYYFWVTKQLCYYPTYMYMRIVSEFHVNVCLHSHTTFARSTDKMQDIQVLIPKAQSLIQGAWALRLRRVTTYVYLLEMGLVITDNCTK